MIRGSPRGGEDTALARESPRAGLVMQEVELDEASIAGTLPQFLALEREVRSGARHTSAASERSGAVSAGTHAP